MKPLRYLILAGLICASQISLSMYVGDEYIFSMDSGLDNLILKNEAWLEEQLVQLGYKDLSMATIEDLVSYFGAATNAFHAQLIAKNKILDPDLFQEKMSHAMSKIVNATIKIHAKVISGKREEITAPQVTAYIIENYHGKLYEGAVDEFPNQ